MDIAAASITMSQARLHQAVNLAVEKKIMDSSENQSFQLIKMLETAVPSHPTSGHHIDLKI